MEAGVYYLMLQHIHRQGLEQFEHEAVARASLPKARRHRRLRRRHELAPDEAQLCC